MYQINDKGNWIALKKKIRLAYPIVSEADLKLRGPGDLMGTQQSGILDLLIADLGKDSKILEIARQAAEELLKDDPNLEKEENALIKQQVLRQRKSSLNWSRIG